MISAMAGGRMRMIAHSGLRSRYIFIACSPIHPHGKATTGCPGKTRLPDLRAVPGFEYQNPTGWQLSLQPVRVRQCKRENVRETYTGDLFYGPAGRHTLCYPVTTTFSNRMVRSPLLRPEGSGQETMESVATWPPAFRVPR